jgi:hypothetical protein
MKVGTLLTGVAVALLAGSTLSAQTSPKILPPEQQISGAVLPAPADMRATATVLGYNAAGKFVTLRKGTGSLVCLASDPASDKFHTSCYHKSLEPFMARGRALRAQGVKGGQVDTVRFKEIKDGTVAMPKGPAVLYQIFGALDKFDPASGTLTGGQPLFVVYIPFATGESVGLSAQPVEGAPWVMYSGTPKAHIMFTPKM